MTSQQYESSPKAPAPGCPGSAVDSTPAENRLRKRLATLWLAAHAIPIAVFSVIALVSMNSGDNLSQVIGIVAAWMVVSGLGCAISWQLIPRLKREHEIVHAVLGGLGWALGLAFAVKLVSIIQRNIQDGTLSHPTLNFSLLKALFQDLPNIWWRLAMLTLPIYFALAFIGRRWLIKVISRPPLPIAKLFRFTCLALLGVGGGLALLWRLGRPQFASLAHANPMPLSLWVPPEGIGLESFPGLAFAVPPGASVAVRNGEDFFVYQLSDAKGKPLLYLYFGLYPQWPPPASPFDHRSRAVSGPNALSSVFTWSLFGYERQVWITPVGKPHGWGVHAWYDLPNQSKAAQADKIIESIQFPQWVSNRP